jgi:hypothetical protein
MQDRQPRWYQERGLKHGVPTMFVDQSAYLFEERVYHLFNLRLGHMAHAAKIYLKTPEQSGEAGREVVHHSV